jgi:UPF0176 protein
MTWIVAALYRFQAVPDPKGLATVLRDACTENNICGTLILAHEGINGTVAAASDEVMKNILDMVHAHFSDVELKMSSASAKPFQRMKVKVKPEIVTMRAAGVDPTQQVGVYVDAKDWNAVISDPDVTVIDTRNGFEFEKGTFKNAIDPGTVNFHEFPAFVEKNLDPKKVRKVAMFCTGGIRCEKASSYMLKAGFETVYHLKGGILKYLETVPESESLWQNECFVFDERVALGHGLKERDQ